QVRGLSEGTATITATLGGLSDASTLTVTKAELETLVLSERQLTLGVGLERKLTVMAFYTNGYLRRVTDKAAWSSSADDVAKVDGGVVYAKRPGVTTLTATLDGITASATVQVIPPGDVVTWGLRYSGGNCDSNSVCERPKEVRAIVSATYAFAAITQDYKVVAWGDRSYGGDTRDVIGADLEDVKEVVGSDSAFAALRRDGKVATWGYFGSRDPDDLDFSALEGLDDVVSITANRDAFAALTRSGRVVVWGRESQGGDNKALSKDLDSGVEAIVGTQAMGASYHGFAALKRDGTVVSWGAVGKCDVCNDLTDVVEVVSSGGAFAALTSKGEVVAWGSKDYGGDTNTLPEGALTEVVQVVGNGHAFAARKRNGSVVAWGYRVYGGDTTQVAAQLNGDVVAIYAAPRGFAAVKKDGSVVSWGHGIDSTNVPTLLRPLSVVGNTADNYAGFAALNDDGTAVSWGSSSYGFDSPPGGGQLQDVRALFSTGFAFAALKGDGTVVTWGDGYAGGNSSTPAGGTLTGVQTIVGNERAFAAIVTPPGAGQ
ncbi:RCC1 domain-containing protein, partial [Aeromonas hydrophila]|uniref:hypothetical protein n=1 Tax=Aeromonas hydrophila TaxID=644 RepID=UPI0038D068B1